LSEVWLLNFLRPNVKLGETWIIGIFLHSNWTNQDRCLWLSGHIYLMITPISKGDTLNKPKHP
jgi:hypothetical protein